MYGIVNYSISISALSAEEVRNLRAQSILDG